MRGCAADRVQVRRTADTLTGPNQPNMVYLIPFESPAQREQDSQYHGNGAEQQHQQRVDQLAAH